MRAWTVVDDAFVAGMADKDNLEWLSAKIFFPVLVSALDMNAMDVRVLLLNKGKTVTRGSRAGIALQQSAEIAAALADDMDIVAARTSVLRVLSETGAGVRFRNAWASVSAMRGHPCLPPNTPPNGFSPAELPQGLIAPDNPSACGFRRKLGSAWRTG